MNINDRHLCAPTPYAGRETTLALCERLGVPLLIVNEHGDTTIVRSTS